jgi:hypothetical protein
MGSAAEDMEAVGGGGPGAAPIKMEGCVVKHKYVLHPQGNADTAALINLGHLYHVYRFRSRRRTSY